MERASGDRDLDELLDEMEAALGELRESLRRTGQPGSSSPSPRAGHRLAGEEAALSATATALEANARALSLLSEAIRQADSGQYDRAASRSETRDRLDRALGDAKAAVGGEGKAGALALLAELRELNAEIASRLEGQESSSGAQGVEITVETELESIREGLGETREE